MREPMADMLRAGARLVLLVLVLAVIGFALTAT